MIPAELIDLAEEAARFRRNELTRDVYEKRQIGDLCALGSDNHLWFQLHVGVPGLWKFPHRFVVDADLYGQSQTEDPAVPNLFRRIILEFTNGDLSLDDFGLALRKLSRRSTREQFDWFRTVLEQRVDLPCSPLLINRVAPADLQVFVPQIPKIRLFELPELVLPKQSVVIEEYIDEPRVFMVGHSRAYDDQFEPDTILPFLFREFQPPNPPLRLELFTGEHGYTLRDATPVENSSLPEWQLPARIETVIEFWQHGTPDLVNVIERTYAGPDQLLAETDLIQQRGFSGFNVVFENGDGLTFPFRREPKIIIESNRILIRYLKSD